MLINIEFFGVLIFSIFGFLESLRALKPYKNRERSSREQLRDDKMLRTNQKTVEKKYKILGQVEQEIKTGSLILPETDRERYKLLKNNVKWGYMKGFGFGLLGSMIGFANYSFLVTRSKLFIALILLPAPVAFPVLWRLREEYVLQNFELGLYQKYLLRRDVEDEDEGLGDRV